MYMCTFFSHPFSLKSNFIAQRNKSIYKFICNSTYFCSILPHKNNKNHFLWNQWNRKLNQKGSLSNKGNRCEYKELYKDIGGELLCMEGSGWNSPNATSNDYWFFMYKLCLFPLAFCYPRSYSLCQGSVKLSVLF